MKTWCYSGVLLLLAALHGCQAPPPVVVRDDVGRIPERLVSGIMTITATENLLLEQEQAFRDAVAARQSKRIPEIEKAAAKCVKALQELGTDPNWVAGQKALLDEIVADYEAYVAGRAKLARLWIVERPASPADSGFAGMDLPLREQHEQLRAKLRKLAGMMAWELTRKIDTVNALILAPIAAMSETAVTP